MRIDSAVASKSFHGAHAGGEHFISVTAPADASFGEQIAFVEKSYAATLSSLGLAPETAIFRRIYLSDALNQAAAVRNSGLFREVPGSPVAVSLVEQPPLLGAKVAMLAYHIGSSDPVVKRRLAPHHLLVEKNGLHHLWSTGLCAGADETPTSVKRQTRDIFGDLIGTLSGLGGTLRDHCLRTWIFLKDVDVFYQGMVSTRRELFEEHGLTGDTHYIASTGIEGACAHRYDLVAMDAYSVFGLAPDQVSYLNDFDRMCPTKDYGVTFERGTRVAYADRSHLFISGTASIDDTGQILHEGDVLRQLDRALENVDGLLKSASANLDRMMHLTVYLRDRTDVKWVDEYLTALFPDLPILIVEGAVCRPGWLVEVEGVAVIADNAPAKPSF